ncbi:amino acid permease [Parendozoicomonas sp. Alg238-R29]|uniref:amino acid permease n=1 Tax=Parendozoicomonas sp. Alg238-R29 TaxID=2993446 RepID=UPI00248F1985|nr:amino acid permease [Parendozoicomonas sp. Alg238-R29]
MEKKSAVYSSAGKKVPVSRYDLAWVMALAGTGLGAGVLYLPFAVGTGGILPILVLTIFCVPLVLFSHRNLSRVCLSPEMPGADMHSVIRHTFPKRYSALFILVCFLSVFPTLLIYAIGITNITTSFIGHQLQQVVPDSKYISAILIILLVTVLAGGEKWLLRVASAMVTPLTLIMLCMAVYLVPYWQLNFLFYKPESNEFWKVILLGLPVMTFSFYHAPMCAVMARGYREHKGASKEHYQSVDMVHLISTVLLFIVILFFVVSSLLCLTPQQLMESQHGNLPILSVLANSSGNPWFSLIAPIIAFLSIATSFFGFFLGTVELINGILSHTVNHITGRNTATPASVHRISVALASVSCWMAAISNWDILEVIAGLVAPMMALVVFFIPLFAIYKFPSLSRMKSKPQDVYVLVGGAVVVTGFIISLIAG